ncbi:MAG: threonine dehydratase [Paracrocinitomix sp.]|jgi:threonine dehydratase
MKAAVTRAEIEVAAALIQGGVRRTPMLDTGPRFFDTAGHVVNKLELLQHTGSFKPRGALHRALTSEVPSSGLIAASGGNHGLAVAWVAQKLGVPCEIFVPQVSPAAKVDKIRKLGATVHVTGALYDDALVACRERQAETGALDIHAYDHNDTIAGAGTIGLEVEADLPNVDTVLVSLGGGGLSSGIAAWFAGTNTKVIVVEPATSQCFAAATEAGEPVDVTVAGVAADSLGARRVGTTNWNALRHAGATSITVPDAAILHAQRRFWSSAQLVVEPGGATAAAALCCGAYVPEPDETVAVIVCGANCDPASVAA